MRSVAEVVRSRAEVNRSVAEGIRMDAEIIKIDAEIAIFYTGGWKRAFLVDFTSASDGI